MQIFQYSPPLWFLGSSPYGRILVPYHLHALDLVDVRNVYKESWRCDICSTEKQPGSYGDASSYPYHCYLCNYDACQMCVERMDGAVVTGNYVCLSVCLSVYQSVCLSVCMSVCLCVCLSFSLSICLSECLSCLFFCLFFYLYVCLSVCLFICLFVYLSVCLFVCLPVCLSVCLSVCMSVCLSACLSLGPTNKSHYEMSEEINVRVNITSHVFLA